MMANNKLTIKVDADTTEALKQMKEVTEAANECVAALEKDIDGFTNKEEPLLQIVQSDINSVPVVLYKGKEMTGKVRVRFDWKTAGHHHKPGAYIHIEHVEIIDKNVNTKIIQYNHPITDKE
ncbi:hypothetical protein V7183_15160 [Bacillus sp. JJ1127]|uniref:hypothetical protein n=1 Tax=Bacillus sp. JJ1127 TaxID=3122952 RepID=UPI002FFFE450